MENSQPAYPLDGIQIHSCQYCQKIVFDSNWCLCQEKSPHGYDFSAPEIEMAVSGGGELFRRERHRARRAIASASNPCLTIIPFLEDRVASLLFDWKDGDAEIDHAEATGWERMVFVRQGINPVLSELSLHRTLNISQKVPLHRLSKADR